MKIFVVKTSTGLMPAFESDQDILRKFKTGETFEVDIKKSRNIKFHKKFFSLLNLGFDNSKSGITDFDNYRAYATMKSGYYVIVKTPDGSFAVPKSISFSKMDELEFGDLYKNLITFVIKDTGANEEDIEKNIINYL